MKKENYGIPTGLLCVGMYLLGLFAAVNTNIWPLIGVTIVVFALSFNSNVKKTAVQALGLALIFCAIYVVFNLLGVFKELISYFNQESTGSLKDYLSNSFNYDGAKTGFDKFLDIVKLITDIAAYVMFIILAVAATTGKGIIVGKVHMIVDGFIPNQQMYGAPQGYNGPQQQGRQPMGGQAPQMQQQVQGMQMRQPMAQGQTPRQPQQPQQQYAGQHVMNPNAMNQNAMNGMRSQAPMGQGQPQQTYARPQQMYNGREPQQMNPNQPVNK